MSVVTEAKPKTVKPHCVPTRVRLTQYAMEQAPGSILTLEKHVADLLIDRGVADEVGADDQPIKSVKGKRLARPPLNKSMASAGA